MKILGFFKISFSETSKNWHGHLHSWHTSIHVLSCLMQWISLKHIFNSTVEETSASGPTNPCLPSYFLQIKDIGLTLNPRAGERAVLIKNHAGDWGLVTGKWTGFRKGVPGIKGRTFCNSTCIFFV